VGQRTEIEPLGEAETVETRPAPDPLVLEQLLPREGPWLRVRAEALEVATGPARVRLHGRAAYVEYRWYTPLVKPLIAVTLIGPFYAAAFDPHAHNGRTWDLLDYLRDTFAWYNLFSAVPTGPRVLDDAETLLREQRSTIVLRVARVPLPQREVVLLIDDQLVARQTTAADGHARLDLGPWLRERTGASDHPARLELRDPEHAAAHSFTLRNALITQFLNERDKVLPIQ